MVNARMVNADLRVSNVPFSVKFSAFWADSCTSKTRLNIRSDLMLTKKRCIFAHRSQNYANDINDLNFMKESLLL
jgi:hypothetical protein